ncbi:Uncharacterised protein [Mycobacteroides abscessus subsp. abscessus]|nr:Uncharacterised protein [Mycobacteroides abscessus subsp. abscessus]
MRTVGDVAAVDPLPLDRVRAESKVVVMVVDHGYTAISMRFPSGSRQ